MVRVAPAGRLSGDDQCRWEAWLREHAEHARAWQRVESIWTSFARWRRMQPCRPWMQRAVVVVAPRADRRVLGLGPSPARPAGPAVAAATTAAAPRQDTYRRVDPATAASCGSTPTAKSSSISPKAVVRCTCCRANCCCRQACAGLRPFAIDRTTAGARLQPMGTRFAVGRCGPDSRLDVFEGVVRCSPCWARR
ncbi:FecR/PupR family sigma factor regulator [Stenotrophomonas rhizophila]